MDCLLDSTYEEDDPTSALRLFLNIVSNQLTEDYKPNNRQRNPWITKGVLVSIKIRNRLLRKKHPLGKVYKSRIRHYIKILRESYFKTQILENKDNNKAQWDLLYNFLKINKKKVTFEGDINTINEHFVNVGQDLADKIPYAKRRSGNRNPHTIYLKPITSQDIENKITILKNNVAVGWDSISTKQLKSLKSVICKPLAHIFNLFLNKGYVPPEFSMQ